MPNERPSLESPEDLYAIIRKLPAQDKFRALGIFRRMQNKQITVQQAMEEFKEMFFRNGIFEPERSQSDAQ